MNASDLRSPHRPGAAERFLLRLEWTVLRRLEGLRQGGIRTLLRGQGLDLADLREYQPHDDVRHIDWNVTARLRQPHVREFNEDRDMNVHFLLDLSASTDWGSVLREDDSVRSKRMAAVELVVLLARLFTGAGHRVGAMLYRRGLDRVLPARGGRGQVLRLLEAIAHPAGSPAAPVGHVAPARPQIPALAQGDGRTTGRAAQRLPWWRRPLFGRARAAPAVAAGESTRLAELLFGAERLLRRRSTLILVSDFLSQPGWEVPLGRLALRHDVIAVRLADPLERELPAAGLLVLEDMESGESVLVDTDDPGLRIRYAALAGQREADLRAALVRAGVDGFELGTDESLLETVTRFLDLRRLRARTGGGAPGGARGVQAAAVPS